MRFPRMLALFGALFALLASAQTPPAADKELPPITLEEFMVTATKTAGFKAEQVQVGTFRDMNPVDVPLTINVVTREVIDAQGDRGIYDALKNTAGVSKSQLSGSTYDNVAIRGITVENRGNYRLNGSLPIINLIDLSLENKERVEVLKGVSALYFGLVPPSGIVNLVTKRPAEHPITSVGVTVNSHGAVSGLFDVSRRTGSAGSFGVRVIGSAGTENTGIDYSKGNRGFASLALDWRANDKLLLRFDYEHLQKNVPEQTAILMNAAVNGVINLPPIPSTHLNLGAPWLYYNAHEDNALLRVDLLLSSQWTVLFEAGRSAAYRERLFSEFMKYDLGTGAGSVTVFPSLTYDYNDNGRVELFGRFRTGPLAHSFSLGMNGNERYQNSRSAPNITGIAQNYYNPVALAPIALPSAYPDNRSEIKDTGPYCFDRVTAFDERVQFMVGARNTNYSDTTVTTQYKKTNEVHPAYSLVFKPTAHSSIYASYLKGLEEGGTAGSSFANAGAVLPPLVSTQKEVGAKAEIFGGVLTQVSFFQIERPSTFTDANNNFTANGFARYRGVEFFASGEVTHDVSLIGSGMLLNAAQLNVANTATYGHSPENLARKSASLYGEWRVPSVHGLSFNAGTVYLGRRPANNLGQIYVGGYSTFSAGVAYRFKVGTSNYIVRVTGDNLTEKRAWSTAGANLLGVTPPRKILFNLTAYF